MVAHLVVRAVEATGEFFLQVDLRGGLLQEVGNPLHQEVPVLQVGKEEGHTVLGADGEWAGQHAGAVCLLHDGHLREELKIHQSIYKHIKTSSKLPDPGINTRTAEPTLNCTNANH